MREGEINDIRQSLEQHKIELADRLVRIKDSVRRGYHPDSKERAQELEDADVVDALGNETRREIQRINAALTRLSEGDFGICEECGAAISSKRLRAQPTATVCIDCAQDNERIARFHS